MRTSKALTFVDSRCQSWTAPAGTPIDGASIPRYFVPFVGAPNSFDVLHAAAIHDAYCGIGKEAGAAHHARGWRGTHRMFFDAPRMSGVPERRAKGMYAAVYLGGPRSEDQSDDTSAFSAVTLARLLAATVVCICENDPSLDEIERCIDLNGAGLRQAGRQIRGAV